jgi:type II secretory pathway component PulF
MALDLSPVAQERNAPGRVPGAAAGLLARLQSVRLGGARTFGTRERMMFTEQLALLLDTGVSLHAALQGLQAQAGDPARAVLLGALAQDLLEGKSLSVALAQHPAMFPAVYVNLVAAGERGGFLPQVLQQLVDMDEKAERLRSTLASALSYPAFLVFFSLATIVFVLVGVFPKFAEMFEQIRPQLPWTTLVLMALSDLLRLHWHWVLAAAAALLAAGVRWWQQPHARSVLDRWKLQLPGLSDLFAQVYLSQTLRVLGLSLANGVPLVDALRACQDVVRNVVFSRFIAGLRQQVTEGEGLAQGFRASPFVPPLVQQMVTTGEETGNLAKVMSRIADHYDRELSRRIALFARLAEPVMLLVMGTLVGLIVASLILPIFKLSRAIH